MFHELFKQNTGGFVAKLRTNHPSERFEAGQLCSKHPNPFERCPASASETMSRTHMLKPLMICG